MENNKPQFKVQEQAPAQGVVRLRNTPEFYLNYVRRWADSVSGKVEKIILEDIATLIGVACQNMKPQQTDSANEKN